MKSRIAAAFAACLAAGCMLPRIPPDHRLRMMIQSPDAEERDREFQTLANSPVEIIPNLKYRLEEGHALGFPCVALLYNLGEGDAVPLELKVLHAAKFSWPARFAEANRVLEPYVWNEIAADLRKVGRPALRLLADALAKESPDEARAMRVCDLMLRIGGHTPDPLIDEFARLLDNPRDLGGVRVADIAGAAILHVTYQDVTLYRSGDLAAAAKARLDGLRSATDDVRLRMGIDAMTEAARDPREGALWKSLAATLSAQGPGTWDEDRRLERQHGVRLRRPGTLRTLWDLRTARWNLPPDPGLAGKWRRWTESSLLRLTLAKVGEDRDGKRGVQWMFERTFHCTEDATALTEGQGDGRLYQLWVQSLELGTRLAASAFVVDGDVTRGDWLVDDVTPTTPLILFEPGLRTGTIVLIEEIERRLPATAPDAARGKLVRLCSDLLKDPRRGPAASRALAYLGETGATVAIRTASAGWSAESQENAASALILLGDPAGLDLGVSPKLGPVEREMARRACTDARLRAWLDGR